MALCARKGISVKGTTGSVAFDVGAALVLLCFVYPIDLGMELLGTIAAPKMVKHLPVTSIWNSL